MSAPSSQEFRFADLWDHVRALVPSAERIGLGIDAHVATLHALPGAPSGLEVLRYDLPRGEDAKTRQVHGALQDRWTQLRRTDVIVAVGGGATTDAVGFAAATLRRGTPWIAVPTTVLAMADAAHGGKTGINHADGKNLIGAFHFPLATWMDAAFLDTLPAAEQVNGLAEVYKSARIGDAALRAQLAAGTPQDRAGWQAVAEAAARVKNALVARDPRDQGVRRHLNYGHTLGHALERMGRDPGLRHGEAVAIGMQAAAHIAASRGLITQAACEAQAGELRVLGLPTRLPSHASGEAAPAALLTSLGFDKKRGAGRDHTWILPKDDIGVVLVDDVSDAEVRLAVRALSS